MGLVRGHVELVEDEGDHGYYAVGCELDGASSGQAGQSLVGCSQSHVV